jgi:CheY-like chemotaxis protein
MTQPLALVFYESLLPGSQLVNKLQDLGYRVVTCTHAPDLARQAKEAKPFVMVIDLTSQQANLCEIVRELKQSPETGHIPILSFTRDGQDDLRARAHGAGATLVTGDVAVLAHLPQLLDQVLEVEL